MKRQYTIPKKYTNNVSWTKSKSINHNRLYNIKRGYYHTHMKSIQQAKKLENN